jgi:hypothetical protein
MNPLAPQPPEEKLMTIKPQERSLTLNIQALDESFWKEENPISKERNRIIQKPQKEINGSLIPSHQNKVT